jgi:hypothetical protein
MTSTEHLTDRHERAAATPASAPGSGVRHRRVRHWCGNGEADRGSLMLYMIPMAVVLLMFAGLVFDGGTALAARGRAADLAAQAARAGADQVSQTSLRTGIPAELRIDPGAARTAGQQVLSAAGATGTITVHGSDVVTVTARVPARTAILSAIGIRDASGTASASATIVHGVTTAEAGQ